MTALRVGDRVRHRVTGREGVVYRLGEALVREPGQTSRIVPLADVSVGLSIVMDTWAAADLIPVEPVPGEGEHAEVRA